MNDKTLLELAAKAAGIEIYTQVGNTILYKIGKYLGHWNPLTDDGDALRLAVKLGLDIELQEDCVYVNGVNVQNYQLFEWHSSDTLKATRRAIVRAAAEIGKSA